MKIIKIISTLLLLLNLKATFANADIIYDSGENIDKRDAHIHYNKITKQLLLKNDFVSCGFYNSRGYTLGVGCIGGELENISKKEDTCKLLQELYQKSVNYNYRDSGRQFHQSVFEVASSINCRLVKPVN